MTAMQQFLKKIGPVGCAIFLGIFILYLAICFSQGRDELKGYEAPWDGAYYAVHTAELARELRENVTPRLEGIVAVRYEAGERVVTVVVEEDRYFPVRRALYRHFDPTLLLLEKRGQGA